MDFVREWIPPAAVTAEMREDAVNTLRRLEIAMVPATEDTIRKWLAALGNLCAARHGAAEAKQAIATYAAMLDHPASCFTRDTLRAAARRFKFWPAFAEVAEFLDGQVASQRALRGRLEALTRAPVTDAPPPASAAPAPAYRDLDAERQAEHDRMMATWRADMAAADQRPAPKAPPETPGQRAIREAAAAAGRAWHDEAERQGTAA